MKFSAILCFLVITLNAIMLPSEYKDENLSGWFMSEKLDGVRGFWNGRKLLSKKMNKFATPSWFIKDFPPFELDGELYTQRNDFENIVSITAKSAPSDEWKRVKFYIFDIPKMDANFSIKYEKMKQIAKNSPFIEVIPQFVAKNNDDVMKFFNKITSGGGEGVVVREPNLIYENGRSSRILKIKKFKDAECIVVAINKGKGKFSGKMGSLDCKMPNGEIFKIGSGFSDIERENPPKIGTIITYKYQNLTNRNKPRFPVFLRIRNEI